MEISRQTACVAMLVVGALTFFYVLLIVQPSEAQQGGATGAGAGGNEGCADPREVETFNGTENQITPSFNITGNTFRLLYDITDLDADPLGDIINIRPVDDGGPVGGAVTLQDPGNGSQNVLEGPGSFTLEIESNGFEYSVTVEDCTGSASGTAPASTPGTSTPAAAPAPKATPSPTPAPKATPKQREKVMRETVPKRRLPPTGGVPAPYAVYGFVLGGTSLLALGLVRRGR